jgi:hypothetical protein
VQKPQRAQRQEQQRAWLFFCEGSAISAVKMQKERKDGKLDAKDLRDV